MRENDRINGIREEKKGMDGTIMYKHSERMPHWLGRMSGEETGNPVKQTEECRSRREEEEEVEEGGGVRERCRGRGNK